MAVFVNLAVAIAAGIVFSALVYAWDSGTVAADINIKTMIVNDEERLVKYVHVKGAIFFSSARDFINLFSVTDDPDTVIIDFKDALIVDHSGVAAIEGIVHRFAQVGKEVLLVNLPVKSHGRLQRTGDHDMMRSQITGASKLKDTPTPSVVDGDEENQADQLDTSARPVSGATTEEIRPLNVNAGIADEGAALAHIPMLQNPVDSITAQLDGLVHEQPHASIHEKTN